MKENQGLILFALKYLWKKFWTKLWRLADRHCGRLSWLVVCLSVVGLIWYAFIITNNERVLWSLIPLASIKPPSELTKEEVVKEESQK